MGLPFSKKSIGDVTGLNLEGAHHLQKPVSQMTFLWLANHLMTLHVQRFSSKFVYLIEEILNLNVKNNKQVQLDDNLSLTTKKISHLCRAHLKDNRWRSPGGPTTTSSHHMIHKRLKKQSIEKSRRTDHKKDWAHHIITWFHKHRPISLNKSTKDDYPVIQHN